MTSNALYNLMTQLTQESRSLWRIEKHYLSDTETDEQKNFWQKMIDDKKSHIKELKDLIKKEI